MRIRPITDTPVRLSELLQRHIERFTPIEPFVTSLVVETRYYGVWDKETKTNIYEYDATHPQRNWSRLTIRVHYQGGLSKEKVVEVQREIKAVLSELLGQGATSSNLVYVERVRYKPSITPFWESRFYYKAIRAFPERFSIEPSSPQGDANE